MMHIFKNILIIALALVLVDRIFTCIITNFIFNKTISGQSGGTINYVIQKKPNLDFLILGSSRAKNSFDPSLLSSLGAEGYNLGINGSTALNSLLVLDILLKHGAIPKTIVFQTDLFEFGTTTEDETIEQLKRVYPYDTELIRDYVYRAGITERIKYFFGSYRFNRKVLNIAFNYFKRNSTSTDNGYVGLPSTQIPLEENSQSEKYTYIPTSTDAEALKKMQKLAAENNIRFIVIFPPTYKNVGYHKKEQEKLVKDLKDNGITNIVDLSDTNLSPALSAQKNWRDNFHLSEVGATRFSKEVNFLLPNVIK